MNKRKLEIICFAYAAFEAGYQITKMLSLSGSEFESYALDHTCQAIICLFGFCAFRALDKRFHRTQNPPQEPRTSILTIIFALKCLAAGFPAIIYIIYRWISQAKNNDKSISKQPIERDLFRRVIILYAITIAAKIGLMYMELNPSNSTEDHNATQRQHSITQNEQKYDTKIIWSENPTIAEQIMQETWTDDQIIEHYGVSEGEIDLRGIEWRDLPKEIKELNKQGVRDLYENILNRKDVQKVLDQGNVDHETMKEYIIEVISNELGADENEILEIINNK